MSLFCRLTCDLNPLEFSNRIAVRRALDINRKKASASVPESMLTGNTAVLDYLLRYSLIVDMGLIDIYVVMKKLVIFYLKKRSLFFR